MSAVVEVVWRQTKIKRFRGKDRIEKAKAFVITLPGEAEEVEAFEVRDGDDTSAWFDTETWKRHEMDG